MATAQKPEYVIPVPNHCKHRRNNNININNNHNNMLTTPRHRRTTFLLSAEAEQSLPKLAQLALHQVDQRTLRPASPANIASHSPLPPVKYFLISAPVDYQPDQFIKRFLLPTGEYVSCVLWYASSPPPTLHGPPAHLPRRRNNLFHISGTDIVRCLAFRFQAFGRPVKNSKKFEEGVFSDLRNLKAGTDAALEEPKSPFLDFLYKNNCIRTQKKQKVFFWYSVPHDRLFLDALERDLKRETQGQEATTAAVSEPALSFDYDPTISLYDQLTKQTPQGSLAAFGETRHAGSKSVSVEARDAESMPPPQTVSSARTRVPEGALSDIQSYSQIPMSIQPQAIPMMTTTHDHYHSAFAPLRPDAMPGFIAPQQHHLLTEYSPAPSLISSQSYQDDYSARGISFEPLTPPQYLDDHASAAQFTPYDSPFANPTMAYQQPFNPPNFPSQHCPQVTKFGPFNALAQGAAVAAPMYARIDGSSAYKPHNMKRHFSSPFGPIQNGPIFKQTYAPRRPSDPRRVISVSTTPTMNGNGGSDQMLVGYGAPNFPGGPVHPPTPEPSRFCSPASANNPMSTSMPPRAMTVVSETYNTTPYQSSPAVFRRARSMTMGEYTSYSDKSHSCPILECGKTFKRLEHLKRHVRTHTQERPFVCQQCNKAFSRSDNLAQ